MWAGWEYYETKNLIIWGGVGEWQLCFNLANCLKAQTDDKETANLVKNSHYGFGIDFFPHSCLLTLFSYNFWKAILSCTEQIEDVDKIASFQEVIELLCQLITKFLVHSSIYLNFHCNKNSLRYEFSAFYPKMTSFYMLVMSCVYNTFNAKRFIFSWLSKIAGCWSCCHSSNLNR